MEPWTFDDRLRDRIRSRLAAHERTVVDDPGRRHAAVALTLVAAGDVPTFLLTQRTRTLRAHSGQYALPGGRLDPGEDATAAALRELEEEVGVRGVEVLGLLDDYPTRSGYRITPVVVWAPAEAPITAQPTEVAHVHHIPLASLVARPPTFLELDDARGPVIQQPVEGDVVFAPTGAVLHQFVEVALYGRSTRVAHFDEPHFARR